MKWLMIILVAISLIVIGFVIFDILGNDDSDKENPVTGSVIQDKEELEGDEQDVSNIAGGVSGGFDDFNIGDLGGGNNEGGSFLPDDLETVGCGFYVEEYGVCTGTCLAGGCVSEGKSCYCRID